MCFKGLWTCLGLGKMLVPKYKKKIEKLKLSRSPQNLTFLRSQIDQILLTLNFYLQKCDLNQGRSLIGLLSVQTCGLTVPVPQVLVLK